MFRGRENARICDRIFLICSSGWGTCTFGMAVSRATEASCFQLCEGNVDTSVLLFHDIRKHLLYVRAVHVKYRYIIYIYIFT